MIGHGSLKTAHTLAVRIGQAEQVQRRRVAATRRIGREKFAGRYVQVQLGVNRFAQAGPARAALVRICCRTVDIGGQAGRGSGFERR